MELCRMFLTSYNDLLEDKAVCKCVGNNIKFLVYLKIEYYRYFTYLNKNIHCLCKVKLNPRLTNFLSMFLFCKNK